MANKAIKKPEVDWLGFLRSHWGMVTMGIAFISACAVFPFKLQAVERKADKIESRQETIEKYIKASEEEKKATEDAIANAPLGWIWNLVTKEYDPDPDYAPPRKKKK